MVAASPRASTPATARAPPRSRRCAGITPGLAAVARHHAERRDPARRRSRVAQTPSPVASRFLGETRELGVPVAWDRPDLMQVLLWKTHLHEFSYAIDLALAYRETRDASFRDGFFALAHAWTDAQPIAKPGFQRVAWNERAVATRLMHWAAAGALFGLRDGDPDARVARPRDRAPRALPARQPRARPARESSLPRHRGARLRARTAAAACRTRLALFEREVREQILADGAHVERCPMYHAVCLADLVDLRALCGDASPAVAARRRGARSQASSRASCSATATSRCSATAGAAKSTCSGCSPRRARSKAPIDAPRARAGERPRAARARSAALRAARGTPRPRLPARARARRSARVRRERTAPCASSRTPAPAPTRTVRCAATCARRRRTTPCSSTAPSCSRRGRASARDVAAARASWRAVRAIASSGSSPRTTATRGSPGRRNRSASGSSARTSCGCSTPCSVAVAIASRAACTCIPTRRRRRSRCARSAVTRASSSRRSTNTSTRRARCADRRRGRRVAAVARRLLAALRRDVRSVRHRSKLDGRVAQLRLDGGARSLAVDWDLDATGAAAVAIR